LGRVCFPFSKQKSEAFGIVSRPIARVTLRTLSGELFDITALVDSGADVSMFSPSVARVVGIELRRGIRKTFHGLGGRIDAYIHPVSLRLGSLQLRARVAFPEIEIPNILGRLDILSKSSIALRDEKDVCFRY
jgi:hypothetical protein